jgi:hypothetical protein
VDISVDLTKKEHNFLPIDAHPSALANRKYAKKLFRFLQENNFLNPTPAEPTLSAHQHPEEENH